MKLKALLLVVLVFLTACSATGERFSGVERFSPESSTLYIFREAKFENSAYCAALYVDEKAIGCLKNGGFIRYEIEPGSHLLEVRKNALLFGPEPKIEFVSQAGEVVFIEWVTHVTGITVAPVTSVSASEGFLQRAKERALEVLRELKES